MRNLDQLEIAQTRLAQLDKELLDTTILNPGPEIFYEHQGSGRFAVTLAPEAVDRRARDAVTQSIEVIRIRTNESGLVDPTIQREGADRIVVQLPGESNCREDILTKTAKLTFQMVAEDISPSEASAVPGVEVFPVIENGQSLGDLVVRQEILLDGSNLLSARLGFDENGQSAVDFSFDRPGAVVFADVTRANIGKRFAIVMDNQIISAPVIRGVIPNGSGQITNIGSQAEADELAVLMRAGALPAKLKLAQKSTVGPGLGSDLIKAGQLAGMFALLGVLVFILIMYGMFGLIANTALAANMVLLLGALSGLGATLTLPGIAGIILTIGMAVDANVLIFERIKEERLAGRSPLRAAELGYKKALSTILDANITTFLAASVLYFLGSGPVKGFAVTLAIGIVTSVFTAFVFARWLTSLWLRFYKPKSLPVG